MIHIQVALPGKSKTYDKKTKEHVYTPAIYERTYRNDAEKQFLGKNGKFVETDVYNKLYRQGDLIDIFIQQGVPLPKGALNWDSIEARKGAQSYVKITFI